MGGAGERTPRPHGLGGGDCDISDYASRTESVHGISFPVFVESIFLSRVEGRGFQVEGEGSMSRVEGNLFFFQNFFFWKR